MAGWKSGGSEWRYITRGGPTNVVRGVITLIRLSELRFVSVICEV